MSSGARRSYTEPDGSVSAELDRTFAALADPTRRAILERLGTGSATISELAEPFGMSLTGMKKHVRVLEEAELVTTEKVGRARRCSLGPRRLEDVADVDRGLSADARDRLDRLRGAARTNRKERSDERPEHGLDHQDDRDARRATARSVIERIFDAPRSGSTRRSPTRS